MLQYLSKHMKRDVQDSVSTGSILVLEWDPAGLVTFRTDARGSGLIPGILCPVVCLVMLQEVQCLLRFI